jgi:hypothetical protein
MDQKYKNKNKNKIKKTKIKIKKEKRKANKINKYYDNYTTRECMLCTQNYKLKLKKHNKLTITGSKYDHVFYSYKSCNDYHNGITTFPSCYCGQSKDLKDLKDLKDSEDYSEYLYDVDYLEDSKVCLVDDFNNTKSIEYGCRYYRQKEKIKKEINYNNFYVDFQFFKKKLKLFRFEEKYYYRIPSILKFENILIQDNFSRYYYYYQSKLFRYKKSIINKKKNIFYSQLFKYIISIKKVFNKFNMNYDTSHLIIMSTLFNSNNIQF